MKHILFIFFDQLRYDAIGALGGNPYVRTPAMDALAAESIDFDRCVTPSPVCVPARLSLLAGQYPARTGNSNNEPKLLYKGDGFYAKLTEGLYKNSCCVGKLHHIWKLLDNCGFATRYAQEPLANDDYYAFLRSHDVTRNIFDYNGNRSEMYYVPQVSQLPAEYHPTQWVADRSLEYLDSVDPAKENIFLMSSIFHPHPPFSPPSPWNKLFRGFDSVLPHVPENFSYDDFAPLLYDKFTRARLGISDLDMLRLRNYYHACVSFADYQVGRLVAKLKEKGMYDDTLIVLSSDHGEMLGDYTTVGKRTMFNGANHIPLLIKMPHAAPGVRHDPCSLVDLAPTLLSYAGIPYDKREYDGVDLFSERHEEVYSQYGAGENGVYMIATERDKLIYTCKEERYFFFEDGNEDKNAYDEKNPKIAALQKKLVAYIASDRGRGNRPYKPDKSRDIPPVFGVRYKDDPYAHDLEMARIPPEYKLRLAEPDTIIASDFLEGTPENA